MMPSLYMSHNYFQRTKSTVQSVYFTFGMNLVNFSKDYSRDLENEYNKTR